MPWVRFDERFPFHRKIRRLSDAAFRLHVSAIHWCSEHLTDGHVPADDLPLVSDVRQPKKAVAELERGGLWEVVSDGWLIHDFLDYQPSAERVREERRKRAEAGRIGGVRSGQSRRSKLEAGSEASASVVLEADASPVVEPRPGPTRTDPAHDGTSGGRVPLGDRETAAPAPHRCRRHKNLPADDPGPPCRLCRDLRLAAEQAAAQRPMAVVPDWCGECSDQQRRQVELDDGGLARCPRCHPLRSVSA